MSSSPSQPKPLPEVLSRAKVDQNDQRAAQAFAANQGDRLTPSELESLRRDDKQAKAKIRRVLGRK